MVSINQQIADGVTDIVLTENVSENVVIPSGKVITLDLAGFTLSNSTENDANEYTISNYGTLFIVDSGETGKVFNDGTTQRGCLVNHKGGIIVIDGGNFEMTGQNWYYIVNMGVSMTINDAEVLGVSPNTSTIRNGFYTDEEKETEYVGGQNALMVINGGNFTGQLIPVKNDEGGELVITGGTFEGPSECVLNWNIGKITGGTFTSPEDKFVIFSGAYDSDMADGKLDITGGTFIGGKGIKDLTPEYAPDKTETAYNYIIGGKWEVEDKDTVTEFIKPGYEGEIDEDGNIIIKKETEWTFPNGGTSGLGLMKYKTLVMHNDSVEYEAGGFEVPIRFFTPVCILGCMAQKGCDGYYNKETKKIQLFRNGVELSERVFDVTIVMIGQ